MHIILLELPISQLHFPYVDYFSFEKPKVDIFSLESLSQIFFSFEKPKLDLLITCCCFFCVIVTRPMI